MAKKEISRRDFLKGMAAGAASMAAIGVLEGFEFSRTASSSGEAAAGAASDAAAAAAESTAEAVSEEVVATVNEAVGSGSYTPGTYTATAQGLGKVTMTATFDETSITAIELDVSEETADIGGVAADELISQCLAAQSSDIEGVSGATLTTNAVKKALDDCIAQASGTAAAAGGAEAASSSDDDWLGEAPEISDADVTEEAETEVLVIGLGLAGVSAARSAAEEGAKVFAVEKGDGPQCRSGEFAVINGNVQKRWGRDIYTQKEINEMVRYHMEESSYKVKEPIVRRYLNNIGEVFDWYVEPNKDLYYAESTRADIPDENAGNFIIPIFYPLPENYKVEEEQFPCYPTSVEFLPNQAVNLNCNMDAALATGNVDARYGCFAEKLIMENGRCTGAYIRKAEDNSYIKVKASKGVILCCGDYSQNDAMVKHFTPDVIEHNIMRLFTNVDVEGNMTNNGDGIRLGMWAGANVQEDHAPMIHHMGGGADLSGVGVMGIAGFLNLDMNGKRFMNEDLPGQQVENQIELLKDMSSWQIFDAGWPEQLPFMPAEHGGACYYEDYASAEEGPKNNATYRNYKSPYQLEAAIADGRCVTADTLEDLVALLYPDDTTAQKTALASIKRYNELCDKGEDLDFGKSAKRMFKLEKAPFYADKFSTALLLVICGGLESDEDCHTFDADRNIIPGLYCAGNNQGNRFAHEYPITLKGVSHGMALYYGYLAGKNAVNGI